MGRERPGKWHDDNASADTGNKRDIIKATEIKKKFLLDFEKPIDEIKRIPREKLRNEPTLKYRSYKEAAERMKALVDSPLIDNAME